MSRNVGTADRAVRIAIGILLLPAVVLVETQARWWGLIGLIPLMTGFVGNCPLYTLIGISTCLAPKAKM